MIILSECGVRSMPNHKVKLDIKVKAMPECLGVVKQYTLQ